jgi:23S rRNA pseudouridine1911/1915/1917 synthase
LDKDTSGLMVVAKNDAAHQALSIQLAGRTMGRIYHAVCLGIIKKDAFTVNLPIGRHPVNRQKMAVTKTSPWKPPGDTLPPGIRQAITHVRVQEYLPTNKPRFTSIEARLETGRTHQIRVHMAFAGHPVWGDAVYGGEKQPKLNSKPPSRQMLHASRLVLVHPRTSVEMGFDCPHQFCLE